ncbi:hypothetical protein FVEG_05743 [Fusarium verticillioides 7600]|uniref:Uncharacterized protein n=1 Tax=Gibberella moniliformis (strain M3125 / FGSC 7600) TaxID=334819 RepID=W7MAZ5_GIBM7|nr:hypothetical protein FVEG_05743 [Fusarium verticillioides 7600]EWG44750.1 hypothetical protein FVEG_05743 [Fusarium verticillioides 7600]
MASATGPSQLQPSDPLPRRAAYGTTIALMGGHRVPRYQWFQRIRHQRRMGFADQGLLTLLFGSLMRCLSSWLTSPTTH